MLASFLSEGRCPLLTRQREGEVFVDADRRVICRMSDGARQRRRPARAVATTRRRRSGKTPHAAFCTWFAPLCKVPGGGGRGAGDGSRDGTGMRLTRKQNQKPRPPHQWKPHQIVTKAQLEEEEEVVEVTRKTLPTLEFSSKIQTSQMAKSVSGRECECL